MIREIAGHAWAGLIDLVFRAETRYSEVSSGLLALGWGLGIWLGYTNDSSATFQQMTAQIPAWVWATYLTVMGLAQVLGAVMQLDRVRVFAAFFVAPFWSFLAVLTAAGSIGHRPDFVAYTLYALLITWAYVRLAGGSRSLRRGFKRALNVIWPRRESERAGSEE